MERDRSENTKYRNESRNAYLRDVINHSMEDNINQKLRFGDVSTYKSLMKERLRDKTCEIKNIDIIDFIMISECSSDPNRINHYLNTLKKLFLIDFTKETKDLINCCLIRYKNGSSFLHILAKYESPVKDRKSSCLYLILECIKLGNFTKYDSKEIVNQKDNDGNTLLHIAVEKNLDFIDDLLELGADISIKNHQNKIPYDLIRYDKPFNENLIKRLKVNRFVSNNRNDKYFSLSRDYHNTHDRDRNFSRDRYDRHDRDRSLNRDRYDRHDRDRNFSRDRYDRHDRDRSLNRDRYDRHDRDRSLNRDRYDRHDRDRSLNRDPHNRNNRTMLNIPGPNTFRPG
ncbi:hypothetical protein ACRRVA_03760, partial [Candidatus Cardinium hertigii]